MKIERPPEEARGTDRNKVAVPRCGDALYQLVMAAEIRLDIEGVAEPGRRAEADDRRTLCAPPMVRRCVLALSGDVMRQSQSSFQRNTCDYEKAGLPVIDPRLAAAAP
jgi:hypothetical protein